MFNLRKCALIGSFWLAASLPVTAAEPAACPPGVTAAAGARINVNTADAAALAAGLKGVGQSKAEAIVRWRETKGKFASLEQLDQVKGIGPGILDKNRDRIVFKD